MELDAAFITVVVDNETDTLSSPDPGTPRLPEIAGLLGREDIAHHRAGRDGIEAFGHLCVACHGFSALVTARAGDTTSTVLFDVGPYGDVWLANAERLSIDLATIGTVFLSHWHWDHSGGFPVVIEAISAARAAAGLAPPVVDVHPDRPDQRGTAMPDGRVVFLPDEPTFAELEASGGDVVRHGERHPVGELLVGSGAIERQTDYETGLPGHLTFTGDEAVEDPLIMDERCLSFRVRGRGVTVLSACSHAGVVNACLEAVATHDDAPVDLVLGGYHLAGASVEGRIDATVRDLDERIGAAFVAPGHCTGWRAKAAMADRFAGGRYAPSAVGTRYVLA
ncbi:MBL fold metallo-hydrolase [Acidimicrobiia bacterium EGI L10123]|uniref:MBL fold metallo-hydrolase n=1 Tax=Salinilacustrithrix flava TaxID=2957203 RepID=UPI003D7C2C07|nr:MBL fold metallo-hydrolase [Acidimicrobiia bacterium EGI L10123]